MSTWRSIAENLVEERFLLTRGDKEVANANFETARVNLTRANEVFQHASFIKCVADDSYASAFQDKEILDKAAALVRDIIIKSADAEPNAADGDINDVAANDMPVYPIFNKNLSVGGDNLAAENAELDTESDSVQGGDGDGGGDETMTNDVYADGTDDGDETNSTSLDVDGDKPADGDKRPRRRFPSWRNLYYMCSTDATVMSILKHHIPVDTDMQFIKKFSNGPHGSDLQMSGSRLSFLAKSRVILLQKYRFILTNNKTGLFVNSFETRTWTRRSIISL